MSRDSFVWDDEAVRAALGLDRMGLPRTFSTVITDSRHVQGGELFVALVGDRFDGHQFVRFALEAGCRGAVVSEPVEGVDSDLLYLVEDTLVGLGALARHRRRALGAKVVGITGSVGKTTTKELLAGALGRTLRVHATPGNLNNRIGLPLTLLSAPADTEVVVAEMGTNEPGEIACLAAIAEADLAIVTAVGESHLEKLGSVHGVLEEKVDLLRALGPGGQAVVGDDPPELSRLARTIVPDARVAGLSELSDPAYRPRGITTDALGRYSFIWKGQPVSLGLAGRHIVHDALLALVASELLGVSAARAIEGVEEVKPKGMRGEIRAVGRLLVVLDCYNSNPQSLRAALDLVDSFDGARARVAVLGSMLELGQQSDRLHQESLTDAMARGLNLVVATGAFARAARDMGLEEGPSLLVVEDPVEAYAALAPQLAGDEMVLLKASRGVALERLLPMLERDFGQAA